MKHDDITNDPTVYIGEAYVNVHGFTHDYNPEVDLDEELQKKLDREASISRKWYEEEAA